MDEVNRLRYGPGNVEATIVSWLVVKHLGFFCDDSSFNRGNGSAVWSLYGNSLAQSAHKGMLIHF